MTGRGAQVWACKESLARATGKSEPGFAPTIAVLPTLTSGPRNLQTVVGLSLAGPGGGSPRRFPPVMTVSHRRWVVPDCNRCVRLRHEPDRSMTLNCDLWVTVSYVVFNLHAVSCHLIVADP